MNQKALLRKLNLGRRRIAKADRELIGALADRFKAVEDVSRVKERLKMGVVQKAQWKKVIARAMVSAKRKKLSPRFVKAVYGLVHKEAIQRQKRKSR